MTDTARSPFPGSDLLAGAALLRLLDLPRVERERDRRRKWYAPARRNSRIRRRNADRNARVLAGEEHPVFVHARALIEPVLKASNVQALRSALADIGLSTAYAELDIELGRYVSESKLEASIDSFELSDRTKRRIGDAASELVAKAMQLYDEAIGRCGSEKLACEFAALKMFSPQQLSTLRRDLVLGDVVHPDISKLILGGLRGSVALMGIAEIPAGYPEWKMIALGESAVEGAMMISKVVDVDLEKEVHDYCAWKTSVFVRVENGEVVDVDER